LWLSTWEVKGKTRARSCSPFVLHSVQTALGLQQKHQDGVGKGSWSAFHLKHINSGFQMSISEDCFPTPPSLGLDGIALAMLALPPTPLFCDTGVWIQGLMLDRHFII
jgi:hypothetical protein